MLRRGNGIPRCSNVESTLTRCDYCTCDNSSRSGILGHNSVANQLLSWRRLPTCHGLTIIPAGWQPAPRHDPTVIDSPILIGGGYSMISNPAKDDSTPIVPAARNPFQYSLRTLLELITVASLGCSLWAWGGEAISRTPEFFVGLAFVLFASGMYLRRLTWMLGGIMVAAGVLVGLAVHSGQVAYESQHTWENRRLSFKVVDAQNYSPIPGATFRITSGKPSARKTIQEQTASDGTITVEVSMNSVENDFLGYIDAYREIEIEVDAPNHKKSRGTLENLNLNHEPIIIIELSK
jgi:hypothetical protein